MSFSNYSSSLTAPTTSSTLNLPSLQPSATGSPHPSTGSIPAEKPSIWTFFRYARGPEPEFRQKARSGRSGKSSNKRLHYCIACWDNRKKSWSTIYTSGARDHLRLNHPPLWKRWLDMENQPASSKATAVSSQAFMNSFLLRKEAASREMLLREAYDRPRHLQALLALCARRRLPLNAIEWPELHDLILSANPEISDLAQLSRRTFTRTMVLNYERYRHILQNDIQIRCLDHILNLALQAFLLATSKEALRAALAAIEEAEDTDPYELFSAYLDVPIIEDSPVSIKAHEQAQKRGEVEGEAERF
ncbi:hypothetical protein ARSEF4850_009010 [Beauveria asiatica]